MMNEQLLRIDRMVDGELDGEQQRELLLRCQDHNQWRDLALAYVESQSLRGELRTYLKEITAEPQHSARRREKESAANWNPAALAVAVMLSLGLGYGMGMLWHGDAGVSPNIAIAEAVPAQMLHKPNEASSMQFMLTNFETNELQSIDLPIVHASDLGPDWQEQFRAQVPEDLLMKMRERGMNMKQARTITPVRLPNGQRVIVPIDYYIEQHYQ